MSSLLCPLTLYTSQSGSGRWPSCRCSPLTGGWLLMCVNQRMWMFRVILKNWLLQWHFVISSESAFLVNIFGGDILSLLKHRGLKSSMFFSEGRKSIFQKHVGIVQKGGVTLFRDFQNGHIAIDWLYFYELNFKVQLQKFNFFWKFVETFLKEQKSQRKLRIKFCSIFCFLKMVKTVFDLKN